MDYGICAICTVYNRIPITIASIVTTIATTSTTTATTPIPIATIKSNFLKSRGTSENGQVSQNCETWSDRWKLGHN